MVEAEREAERRKPTKMEQGRELRGNSRGEEF